MKTFIQNNIIRLRTTKQFNTTFLKRHTTEMKLDPSVSSSNVKPNNQEFNQGLTEDQKKNMKRFDILRYDPSVSQEKSIITYYVDLKNCGPMVLDALIHIKDDIDSTLSFRRSCREGICGSCSMNIDGRNTLACLSYINKDVKDTSFVLPLPYFQIVRDLVVDMTNFYMQYKSIMPVLQRKTEKAPGQKEYLQSQEDRKHLDGLYECILCACCSSHCPSYWWQSNEYLGPAVLMQAYRWIIDSRDEYQKERLDKLSGQKLDRCYQIGACSLTCPKGLDPRANVKKLQELYADYRSQKLNALL